MVLRVAGVGSSPKDFNLTQLHMKSLDSKQLLPILTVFDRQGNQLLTTPIDRVLELGRQRKNEIAPIVRRDKREFSRIVIVGHKNTNVSRNQARVSPLQDGSLRIQNTSRVLRIKFRDGTVIAPGDSTDIKSCAYLKMDALWVRLDHPQWSEASRATVVPNKKDDQVRSRLLVERTRRSLLDTLGSSFDEAQGKILLTWLNVYADLFQAQTSFTKTVNDAVRAVHSIVGFDFAGVFTIRGKSDEKELSPSEAWKLEAQSGQVNEDDGRLHLEILNDLRSSSSTEIYNSPDLSGLDAKKELDVERGIESEGENELSGLGPIASAIAVPIHGRQGEIIGALLATRQSGEGGNRYLRPRLNQFEASLVELVGRSISTGWTRQEHRKVAVEIDHAESAEVLQNTNQIVTILAGRITGSKSYVDDPKLNRESDRIAYFRTKLQRAVTANNGILLNGVDNTFLAAWPHINHATAATSAFETSEILSEWWESSIGDSSTRRGKSIAETEQLEMVICTGRALLSLDEDSSPSPLIRISGQLVENLPELLLLAQKLAVGTLICAEARSYLANIPLLLAARIRTLSSARPIELFCLEQAGHSTRPAPLTWRLQPELDS